MRIFGVTTWNLAGYHGDMQVTLNHSTNDSFKVVCGGFQPTRGRLPDPTPTTLSTTPPPLLILLITCLSA
ncbi:hypothetical protein E2C01_072613 [Portunus trituberculatus]|uniref:Uncharacterized protein n=1 Tax=Portunus trituberculatus TaxID=210409 RepID=A0A5B7I762_PORTR|nr:hypothetical protein [Portunus trituberculatus]